MPRTELKYRDIPRVFLMCLPFVILLGLALSVIFDQLSTHRHPPILASAIAVVVGTHLSVVLARHLLQPSRRVWVLVVIAYLITVVVLVARLSGILSPSSL